MLSMLNFLGLKTEFVMLYMLFVFFFFVFRTENSVRCIIVCMTNMQNVLGF